MLWKPQFSKVAYRPSGTACNLHFFTGGDFELQLDDDLSQIAYTFLPNKHESILGKHFQRYSIQNTLEVVANLFGVLNSNVKTQF